MNHKQNPNPKTLSGVGLGLRIQMQGSKAIFQAHKKAAEVEDGGALLGRDTVDGGNLAPPRGPELLYFLGLWGPKVMQDFLHQQQDLGDKVEGLG